MLNLFYFTHLNYQTNWFIPSKKNKSLSTDDSFNILFSQPGGDEPALSCVARLSFVSQTSLGHPFPEEAHGGQLCCCSISERPAPLFFPTNPLWIPKHILGTTHPTPWWAHRGCCYKYRWAFPHSCPQSVLHKQQVRSNVLMQFIYKWGRCEWRLKRDVKY